MTTQVTKQDQDESAAIAEVLADALTCAYDRGYAAGLLAGKLEGLEKAKEIMDSVKRQQQTVAYEKTEK